MAKMLLQVVSLNILDLGEENDRWFYLAFIGVFLTWCVCKFYLRGSASNECECE